MTLIFRTFSALFKLLSSFTRSDAFRCASRLPLAFIFRAFGAQSNFALDEPLFRVVVHGYGAPEVPGFL